MATHRAPSTRARRAATVGALAAASLALAPAAFAGDASGSHDDSPVVSTPETDCTPLLDVDADLSDTELADLELLCTDDGDALLDLG